MGRTHSTGDSEYKMTNKSVHYATAGRPVVCYHRYVTEQYEIRMILTHVYILFMFYLIVEIILVSILFIYPSCFYFYFVRVMVMEYYILSMALCSWHQLSEPKIQKYNHVPQCRQIKSAFRGDKDLPIVQSYITVVDQTNYVTHRSIPWFKWFAWRRSAE